MMSTISGRYRLRCCLYSCRKEAQERNNVTCHVILPEWIPLIRTALEDPQWQVENRKICSLHFDEKERTFLGATRRGLQRGATPKYYLSSTLSSLSNKTTTREKNDDRDNLVITSSYSLSSTSSDTTTTTTLSSSANPTTTTTTTSSEPMLSTGDSHSSTILIASPLLSPSSVTTSYNLNNSSIDTQSDIDICDNLISPSSSNFTTTTTVNESVSSNHQQHTLQPLPTNSKTGISKIYNHKNIISRIRNKYVLRGNVYEQLELCKKLLAISESKVRNLTESNEFYENEIETLKNKEKDLIILCDELITKLVKYEMDQNMLKNLNFTFKMLLEMEQKKQDAKNLSDIRYTSDILKFARKIHSYSEECYEFLRKDLPLPDPQTLLLMDPVTIDQVTN